MQIIFTPEQFRTLDHCFEAAAPDPANWRGQEPPVPYDVVAQLRSKMHTAEASRNYVLDLDDEEAQALSACFQVGGEGDDNLNDATYNEIVDKLAGAAER